MSEQVSTGPRVRWGAIIWGTLFASVAAWGLWIVVDAGRRAQIADTIVETTPFTVVMWVVLAVGGLVLVGGIVALVRRAQRARAVGVGSGSADVGSAGEIPGNIEKPEDSLGIDVADAG